MEPVVVKIKKLSEDAVIPKYGVDGDGAMDLTATNKSIDKYGNKVYGTGLAIEIPYGYVGLIFPRSSVSKKTLNLANSIGVIDAGYRGEIICKFKPTLTFKESYNVEGELIIDDEYKIGERIAQIMIIERPTIKFIEVDELSDSDRGLGAFGSTGK